MQPCQALAVIRQADNNNHAASAFHDPRSQAGEPGTAAPTTPSLGVVALVASLLCAGAWPVAAAGVSGSGSGSGLALAWYHQPALAFVALALVVWAGALCSKPQVRVLLPGLDLLTGR